ncbi:MAG: 50S ribosomal protein P1 [archaeon]
MEYIYAALLLHSAGQQITEENLKKVVSATGAKVDEAKIKVIAEGLQGVNIDEILKNATIATAAPAQAPAAAQPAATETKKEEKKEEEAAGGLAALFG